MCVLKCVCVCACVCMFICVCVCVWCYHAHILASSRGSAVGPNFCMVGACADARVNIKFVGTYRMICASVCVLGGVCVCVCVCRDISYDLCKCVCVGVCVCVCVCV